VEPEERWVEQKPGPKKKKPGAEEKGKNQALRAQDSPKEIRQVGEKGGGKLWGGQRKETGCLAGRGGVNKGRLEKGPQNG